MTPRQRILLSFNPEEAVVHEVGHAKTIYANRRNNIPTLYKKLEKMGIDDISKIASKDGAEAVAEIEVLLHRGEKISDEARKLYESVMKGDVLQ
jgi:hypothetical protein